jgi:hypothetical protein
LPTPGLPANVTTRHPGEGRGAEYQGHRPAGAAGGLRPVRNPEREGFPPAEPGARQAWLENYRIACEQAEWTVELDGLSREHGEWVLSVGRSQSPVATLRHADDPAMTLNAWREPARKIGDAELTPDVTVSTPSPYGRDLLVVEAKDRVKMPSGLGSHPDKTGARSALGVAERYARGLQPRAVWVRNHCDFRQPASAEVNHGNAWTQVHVADKFRPDQVPGAFNESVRAALAPPPRVVSTARAQHAAKHNTLSKSWSVNFQS